MGVVTDKSLQGLTTAVQGISTSGMTDTTGQAIASAITALAGSISPTAENVSFDNTGTGLTSSDVEGAIKEVNTKVDKIELLHEQIDAGNKTIADIQSWCKTASRGLLWGVAYLTSPKSGWCTYLIVNKVVADSYSEMYLFLNDGIISSYTGTLTATTPTWTTKQVNLT